LRPPGRQASLHGPLCLSWFGRSLPGRVPRQSLFGKFDDACQHTQRQNLMKCHVRAAAAIAAGLATGLGYAVVAFSKPPPSRGFGGCLSRRRNCPGFGAVNVQLRSPYAGVTHSSTRYGAQYAALSSTVTSPHDAPYVHRQRTMGPSVPMAVCPGSSPTFCSEVNVRYEAGG